MVDPPGHGLEMRAESERDGYFEESGIGGYG